LNNSSSTGLDRINKVALIAILSAPGVGNRRAIELVSLFETPDAVIGAPAREIALALNVNIQIGKNIVKSCRKLEAAEEILKKTEEFGADFVSFWDDRYPERLKKIPDPPAALYISGVDSPLYDYSIAIVGTRGATDHAKSMSYRISRDIAASGVTVVSGMALGIDTAAHEGALQAGGRTVAVFGCGIDVVYPPSNRKLFERIQQQGAIMSEYPPGMQPNPGFFPSRNRIISGLSLGVLVVEAGRRSGALITARLALEQGRELFALPGLAGAHRTVGVNNLLRDGSAHLVESGAEILDHLRSQIAPITNVAASMTLPKLNESENSIYNLLEDGSCQIDQLIRSSEIKAVEMNRLLTSMQLKGLIRQLPGARVERI